MGKTIRLTHGPRASHLVRSAINPQGLYKGALMEQHGPEQDSEINCVYHRWAADSSRLRGGVIVG